MICILGIALAQATAQLPETVVVESRQTAPLVESSPSVSKVTINDATDAGYVTLSSVIATTPGVFATEQSGEGSQASLFFRGTNSSQSVVLLDGRRLPEGFSGSYEIGRYRIFGLSSVEILRGPSSSLYGANALGGVVDLRLAEPLTSTERGAKSIFEVGSYGRYSLALSYLTNNANEQKAATYGTAISITRTHDDGWRDNSQRDNYTALIKSEWQLSPHLVFDLLGSFDHGNSGLPGQATATLAADPNDWQKDNGWMLSPGLRYQDTQTKAALFWSHGDTTVKNYVDGSNFYGAFLYSQKFILKRDEVTAFADQKFARNLTLGVGATFESSYFDQQDLAAGISTWTDTMESLGFWGRADWAVTSNDRIKASLRHDSFTDFAGKSTWELNYSRKLTKQFYAHAKVATSYRAPSANDLAYGTSGGLPLRPESNRGTEIGLRYESEKRNRLNWTLVAFKNELTDLIDFDPADNYKSFNIAKAETRGVELGVESQLTKNLRVFAAATTLKTEALSDYLGIVAKGQSLLRRPTFTLNVGTEFTPNEKWVGGIALNHIEGRDDFDWDTGNRVSLPNANYWRTWIRYSLNNGQDISLRIENLTGETAPPSALGYGAQPRSAYLSFTAKF
jgi:vitamin B12 transporter